MAKKATTSKPIEQVQQIPLSSIEHTDTRYRFRMRVNVNDLAADVQSNGQQIPIVVRPKKGEGRYQVVCGFRRLTALRRINADTALAIVRDLSDDEALQLAWAENEQRRSYTELDRAHAIVKAQQDGKTIDELENLFGLRRRQLYRVRELANVDKKLQNAVESDRIPTTHAVTLNKLKRDFPNLDLKHWIKRVEEENLSVNQLRRRVREEQSQEGRGGRPVVEEKGGAIRVRQIRPDQMSEEERREAVQELEQLVERLRGKGA